MFIQYRIYQFNFLLFLSLLGLGGKTRQTRYEPDQRSHDMPSVFSAFPRTKDPSMFTFILHSVPGEPRFLRCSAALVFNLSTMSPKGPGKKSSKVLCGKQSMTNAVHSSSNFNHHMQESIQVQERECIIMGLVLS